MKGYQRHGAQRHEGPNPLSEAGYGQYLDKDGHLKPEYVDRWADELAQLFGANRLTKSQMRAFFNEVKRLQTVFRANQDFKSVGPKLLAMKAQAHLRKNRGSIPSVFQEFVDKNVSSASNPNAFAAFVQHFEAVAAYCEGRLKRE